MRQREILAGIFVMGLSLFAKASENCGSWLTTLEPGGAARASVVGGLAFEPWNSVDFGAYVIAIALSPDGQHFVAGTREVQTTNAGRAAIFSLQGSLIANLEPGSGVVGNVSAVDYSPTGKSVVTCWEGGTCKVWGPNGHLIKTYANLGEVQQAKLSIDGRHLAVSNRHGQVVVIDVTTDRIQQLQGATGDIGHLQFSPDGQRILASGRYMPSPTVVWDLAGRVIYKYEHDLPEDQQPPSNWYTIAKFSPDGKHMLTGFFDGTVQVHDFENGTFKSFTIYPYESKNFLESVEISPNGKTLIAGIHGENILLVDLETTAVRAVQPDISFGGNFTQIVAAPDGTFFIAINMDRKFSIWDYHGRLIGHLVGPFGGGFPLDLKITPDSRFVVAGTNSNRSMVWQLRDAEGNWTTSYPAQMQIPPPSLRIENR